MEELFDIYDENGKHLGVTPKSFCHSENPGVFHKPVWICKNTVNSWRKSEPEIFETDYKIESVSELKNIL